MMKKHPFEGVREMKHLNDGGLCFRLTNKDGDITMTRYPVFPGIDIIYNDVHMPYSFANVPDRQKNMIEIDHCREGRLECQVGEEYFYLAPGDISIHRLGETVREEIFPTSHYHGITIQIDLSQTPKCLSDIMEDVNVEPGEIAKKLRLDENFFFALRQLPAIEHIFSELYAIPEAVKKGYFKVKVLEIFLFLSSLETEKEQREQRRFSRTQVVLAKKVCDYLMEHLEQHITIAELAEIFGVSASQVKNSFDGVYGVSVYSYMRSQRMQAAAALLKSTDRTVLDIASQFGYDNGSKFAGAFRTVMGVTPTQYRNSLIHKE